MVQSEWRNWQTRTLEGRVRQLVEVQVLSPTPHILSFLPEDGEATFTGCKVQQILPLLTDEDGEAVLIVLLW